MKMTFCLSSCDLLTFFVKNNFFNGIVAVNGPPPCSENMTIHFDPDLRCLDRISSGTNLINTGKQIPRFSITVLKFSKCRYCGEPAISHDSYHVSLVQWTTCLLPTTRDTGSNPLGGLM